MAPSNQSSVARFYNAIAGGDVTTALELLGDEVEWHEAPGMPYEGEHPYVGAAEVAQRVLGPINSDIDGLTLTVEELLELGRHVAVVGRYGGAARASRRPIDLRFVHIWTLDDDGLPREFRQYTDTSRFRSVLAPPADTA